VPTLGFWLEDLKFDKMKNMYKDGEHYQNTHKTAVQLPTNQGAKSEKCKWDYCMAGIAAARYPMHSQQDMHNGVGIASKNQNSAHQNNIPSATHPSTYEPTHGLFKKDRIGDE
jgi:hypothetical protein